MTLWTCYDALQIVVVLVVVVVIIIIITPPPIHRGRDIVFDGFLYLFLFLC